MKGLTIGLLLALAASAAQGQVYRWTDEHGRVHFGDRPRGAQAEEVEIREAPPAAPQAEPQGVPDRDRLLEMYRREREDKRAAKAEQARQQAERERDCRKLAHDLRRYLAGGPLYEDRDDGTRHYFTAAEKDAEMAEMRGLLNKYCGGVPAELRSKTGR